MINVKCQFLIGKVKHSNKERFTDFVAGNRVSIPHR